MNERLFSSMQMYSGKRHTGQTIFWFVFTKGNSDPKGRFYATTLPYSYGKCFCNDLDGSVLHVNPF